MKNKKCFAAVLALALSIFWGGSILAQNDQALPAEPEGGNTPQMYILATVGISDQKIVSQDNNIIKIAFDISNSRNSQPDLRYAIRLAEGSGDFMQVVDEKAYDEVLSLNANEKKHKEVTYSAPAFLKGDYQLSVIAFTSSMLEVANEVAGDVVLNGSGEYLRIVPESCNLIVEGDEENIYTISQGVDIKPEETLTARCLLENRFKKNVIASANFATHYRSSLGQKISEKKGNNISFPADKADSLPIIFKLPKAVEPQAYDCVLSFQNEQGKTISNQIPFHYVLRGASATIQNLRLDKSTYVKGDTAVAIFDVTPSADTFTNSRFGPTDIGQIFSDVVINDENGQECSRKENQIITTKDTGGSMNVSLVITKDCPLPKVSVRVKNKEGQILASQNYFIGSDSNTAVLDQYGKEQTESGRNLFQKNKNAILLIISIIPIVILLVYLIRRKKINFTIFFLIAIAEIFLLSGQAQAFEANCAELPSGTINATVTVPGAGGGGHRIGPATYNIRINKLEYSKGDTMTAYSRTINDVTCNNGASASGAWVEIDGQPKTQIYYMNTPVHYETKNFDIDKCPYNDDFGVRDIGKFSYDCSYCDENGCNPQTCEGEGYFFDPNNKLDESGKYKYKGSSNEWFRAYSYGYVQISNYYNSDNRYRVLYFTEPFSETIKGVKYYGNLRYTITYIDSDRDAGFDKCRVNYFGMINPADSVKLPVNSASREEPYKAQFKLSGAGRPNCFNMPYYVTTITPPSVLDLNLQINKSGEGNGKVSFSPAKGSSCSASCTKTYDSGTSVTMTASSSNGSDISWGGGCDSKSGNSCRVNMNKKRNVSVTFSKSTPPITPPPPSSPSPKEWKEVAP